MFFIVVALVNPSDLANIIDCSKGMEVFAGVIKSGRLLVGLMSHFVYMLIDHKRPCRGQRLRADRYQCDDGALCPLMP